MQCILTDYQGQLKGDSKLRRGKRALCVVAVYSRPTCHLCAEALERLVALRDEGYRFELHEIDIESEKLLFRRLLEKIPVVEIDGEFVSELVLDEAAVRAKLDTVGA